MLLIPLALAGCATRYGVTVWIDHPGHTNLSCATRELRQQGVKVSRDSATQAVISEGGNVATLSVTERQFEIAETSFYRPLSCSSVHDAAPFLRKVIAVIEDRCVGNGTASLAEAWNQDQCGTSFATGRHID